MTDSGTVRKQFLRLKGMRFEADPSDVHADFPMRISAIERGGVIKVYAEQCVNGHLMWWPYVNYFTSLPVRPA
jgi:hypothetical protein